MVQRIVIVGGCGHIGLPLGIALARVGFRVVLVDNDPSRVAAVQAGRMPFTERGAAKALAEVHRAGRLEATTDPAVISQAETVIVTIGTPVDEFLDPSVRAFDQAIESVLARMHDGQLLILRSTLFPGVTDRLTRRLAEGGPKLDLAYCPERIAQGYALEELGSLPQLVAGASPLAVTRARRLFKKLGAKVLEVAPIEAELAKLFANAYRYINFAISNQLYMIAERFGADFHRIHTAVTTDYPRMASFAKAGFAGGPCLLKDTMQLAAFNHNAFAIGQAAMMVNEGLPRALVDSVKAKRNLSGETAAILGMAFKGNCDDPRDSLAYKLRKVLTLECRRVLCTDPYIDDESFVPLEQALAEADVLFIGACHDEYRTLTTDKPVIDVFHFVQRPGEVVFRRKAA